MSLSPQSWSDITPEEGPQPYSLYSSESVPNIDRPVVPVNPPPWQAAPQPNIARLVVGAVLTTLGALGCLFMGVVVLIIWGSNAPAGVAALSSGTVTALHVGMFIGVMLAIGFPVAAAIGLLSAGIHLVRTSRK
ncbi:MAG: hypothetical protein LBV06_02310 [Propionibacteriaceae bacterium]|jgi:hypothetical protein|nr:hypothetical protein [Propionibacteriaceae bacterium]